MNDKTKISVCHLCNGEMQEKDIDRKYCPSCKIYQCTWAFESLEEPELCLKFLETRIPRLPSCYFCEGSTEDKDGRVYCQYCKTYYGYTSYTSGLYDD